MKIIKVDQGKIKIIKRSGLKMSKSQSSICPVVIESIDLKRMISKIEERPRITKEEAIRKLWGK